MTVPAVTTLVHVRLFDPQTTETTESIRGPGDLTLRECFEAYVLPSLILENRAKSTIAEYYSAIRHWERRTDNLPIGAITDQHMAAFLAQFCRPVYRTGTRRKVWRQMRPIFRRLAPETETNFEGMGIIARVPRVRLPKIARRANRLVADEELNALYEACSVATWPHVKGVTAPAMWRAALVSLTNLAPRAWDFFCKTPRDPGASCWQWDSINWKTQTIRFLAEKTEDELRLPMHPVVSEHLQSIRTDRRVVFPASRNRNSVYGQWRKIKVAADIKIRGPEDLSFQQLRANCQTEWDTLLMGLGDFILGHAPAGVGPTWYRNFQKKAVLNCPRFPQPSAFLEARPGQGRQMRLFQF